MLVYLRPSEQATPLFSVLTLPPLSHQDEVADHREFSAPCLEISRWPSKPPPPVIHLSCTYPVDLDKLERCHPRRTLRRESRLSQQIPVTRMLLPTTPLPIGSWNPLTVSKAFRAPCNRFRWSPATTCRPLNGTTRALTLGEVLRCCPQAQFLYECPHTLAVNSSSPPMLLWFEILEAFMCPSSRLWFFIGSVLFTHLALLCTSEVMEVILLVFVSGWINFGLVVILRLSAKFTLSRIPNAVHRYAEFDDVIGKVHTAAALALCCILLICFAISVLGK